MEWKRKVFENVAKSVWRKFDEMTEVRWGVEVVENEGELSRSSSVDRE